VEQKNIKAKIKVVGLGNQGVAELIRIKENTLIAAEFISYESTTFEKLNEALFVFILYSLNDNDYVEIELLRKLKSSVVKVGIALNSDNCSDYSTCFNAHWVVDLNNELSATKIISIGLQMLIDLGNSKGLVCIDMADVVYLLKKAKTLQMVHASQPYKHGINGLFKKISDSAILDRKKVQTIMLLFYLPIKYKLELDEIGWSLEELLQSFNNNVEIAWNICQGESRPTALLTTEMDELCCIAFFGYI
jgi:cell division GTPase FtsZ